MSNKNTELYQLMSIFSDQVRKRYYPNVDKSDWQIKGNVFGFRAGDRLGQKNKRIKHQPGDPRLIIRFQWVDHSDLLSFKLSSDDAHDQHTFTSIVDDFLSFLTSNHISCVVTTRHKGGFFSTGSGATEKLLSLISHLWDHYKKPKGIHNYVFVPRLDHTATRIDVRSNDQTIASLSTTSEIDEFITKIYQIKKSISTVKRDFYSLLSDSYDESQYELFNNINKFKLHGVLIYFWIKHKSVDGQNLFSIRIGHYHLLQENIPSVHDLLRLASSQANSQRLHRIFS